MKLFLSTLFVTAMAATMQAVTVAWTLQNSYWIYAQEGNLNGSDVDNWTGVSADAAPTLDVYVFFSEKNYDAEGAADYVSGDTSKATMAGYVGSSNYGTNKVGSSTLNVTAELTGGTGYYYMVIFNSKTDLNNAEYAVAKTTQITGVNNSQGIYDTTVDGTTPDSLEYVQLDWMADSTWSAPKMTPEPTALALLALGVAGLALRRKNA